MRVLVTGGAGFIGSHLVEALVARGTDVAVLDDLSAGKRTSVPNRVPLFEVDVRDAARVAAAFEEFRPTHVSHHAAQASVKLSVDDPGLDGSVNIIGGIRVLDACRAVGVERVVFASTGGALYGEVADGERATEAWAVHPKSPYAVSKASFELYLDSYKKLFDLRSTTLRYANVFGPRQDPFGEAGVVAIFSRRLLDEQPMKLFAKREVGDAGCIRDYVFVSDVVAANLAALDRGLDGTFNVATGIGRSTRDILDALSHHAPKPPTVEPDAPRAGDLERSVLDNALLTTHGWSPAVSFDDGIQRTLEWFRQGG